MNEQDFILLTEEYLDGSISTEGRTALSQEVQSNPDRRRLFEEQARQNIRLHAQTSRVDFTESQHIAMMAVDIVEKHKDPNAFMDALRKRTLRERLSILWKGLHAERGTPAHRAAKDELMRIFGPVTISMAVNVALIILIFSWVPHMLQPTPPDKWLPPVSIGQEEPTPTLTPVVPPSGAEPDSKQVIPPDSQIQQPTRPSDVAGGGDREPVQIIEAPDTSGPATDTVPYFPTRRSAGNLPGLLEGRTAGIRTGILIKQHATQTDVAVVNSLRWLKSVQSADGSWRGQDAAAMTGLALLAYLAHSELPGTPEFGDTVTRGLKYLLAHQDAKGSFSGNVYAHAIATYAVAEAFTMTRIVELKAPLDKAVRIILDGQQSNGSFDYNYRKGPRFDTSVTGWQIQALKSARIAGADEPGLEQALDRSARFLQKEAFAHDGSGFVYEGKPGAPAMSGGRPSMTGVGTLCLQMLGKGTSAQVRTGLKALQKAQLEWPLKGKAGVYAGYYVTQAKFQANNTSDWKRWEKTMVKCLISKQNADGHWEQGDYDNGSHVYTTTLCTLMLEVYYRYLPTYAVRPESEPPQKMASGDVSVDVR